MPVQEPEEAVKAEPALAAPETAGATVLIGAAVIDKVATEAASAEPTELVAVT